MSKGSKVLLGWALISLVIAFSDSLVSGVGTFIIGLGIWLIGSAGMDFFNEIDDRDKAKNSGS